MNKKLFDRRMESSIGLLDAGRGWLRSILVFVIPAVFSIVYWIASTYEPGLKSISIDNYCFSEAHFGCFYIPGSIVPWGYYWKISHYWLPWSFFVRQLLLFPMMLITYFSSWGLRALRWWKLYWITMFLFMFSYLDLWATIGEGVFDFGLIDFFWREVFAWSNLIFMIFVLTLSLWNRKLLEKLAVFQSVALLAGGLGGGGAALGVFLSRMLSHSKSGPSVMMVFGLVGNFLIVPVSGMKFSQLLWNASPWRLEAEIRAKENGEDPAPWAKITKLIF